MNLGRETGLSRRYVFPIIVAAGLAAAAPSWALDRFSSIIAGGAESTVNSGGYVVNHKREDVQKELAARPPTFEELGVKVPPKAKLKLTETARQIVQYDPVWRIFDYKLKMGREEFVAYFLAQGLTHDENRMVFPGSEDFIDGIAVDGVTEFRIWRKVR